MLVLSNANKFIFGSDKGASKKSLKETPSRLKETKYNSQREIKVWKYGYEKKAVI